MNEENIPLLNKEFFDANIKKAFTDLYDKEKKRGKYAECDLNSILHFQAKLFFFVLLALNTPLKELPTCIRFNMQDFSKFESEFGFTVIEKYYESLE